ncbi:MAG: SAM-dependent methyltransferase, partial [Hyphomicrobiaceae bacterium]
AYPHAMSRDGVHARALSTSFIARLSSAEKQALRASIDAVLDAHGLGTTGITMPYVSHLYLLTRQ